MVGKDLVEHHSKLLRRAAAKALLDEPFEDDLARAVSELETSVGGLERPDAASLLGRVATNLRDDIRSATIPLPSARSGERVLDARKRVEALADAADLIEQRLWAICAW